jgi:hypothetical protein
LVPNTAKCQPEGQDWQLPKRVLQKNPGRLSQEQRRGVIAVLQAKPLLSLHSISFEHSWLLVSFDA